MTFMYLSGICCGIPFGPTEDKKCTQFLANTRWEVLGTCLPLSVHFSFIFLQFSGKNLVNDMFLPQTRGLALRLIKEILVPPLTVLHNTAKFRNVSYDYLKFVMVN